MGGAEPDAALAARLDRLEAEVAKAARPSHYARLVDIADLPPEDGAPRYRVGPLVLASADLRRVLRGARRAYLFAATLGHEVDRLIRRTAVLSAADLLIVQAIATALIEAYIDDVERTLEGPRTPRYSPGYGDLPLSVQRDFLAAIDGHKNLGITLTEACLMIPSKSVTAIIGVLS